VTDRRKWVLTSHPAVLDRGRGVFGHGPGPYRRGM